MDNLSEDEKREREFEVIYSQLAFFGFNMLRFNVELESVLTILMNYGALVNITKPIWDVSLNCREINYFYYYYLRIFLKSILLTKSIKDFPLPPLFFTFVLLEINKQDQINVF